MSKGDTFARLGADFGVATDTAWRYIREGVDILAPLAPTLAEALEAAGDERRLLLDGTLIRTWRCVAMATDTNADPLFNAKHHDRGMNPGDDDRRRRTGLPRSGPARGHGGPSR